MTAENAVKRISTMESAMDEVVTALEEGTDISSEPSLKKKIAELSEYMSSGLWQADYTRHEKGELPKDLKCGVLSQDTLYDLLTDIEERYPSFKKERHTKKKTKRILLLAILAALLSALIFWIHWGNTALEVNRCTVTSQRLPNEFNGFTVAHLSDLHNEEIEGVIPVLTEAKPDVIVITGDIIDGEGMDVALSFAQEVVKIAPCYYVTGNHEARILGEVYDRLEKGLKEAGITVLHDQKVTIEKDGAEISIIGLDDPKFAVTGAIATADSIKELADKNNFTLLLSHRPELFDRYVEADVDLVLSGHAHGGQVRLPFIGGLLAPDQGLFPKYDSGLYTENNTNMIVSRGIGNGTVVPRINNRPEIIFIELQSAKN